MSIVYNKARFQIGARRIQKPEPGLETLQAEYVGKRFISKEEYQILLEDLKLSEVYVTIIELWFSVIEEIKLLKEILDGFTYDFYKDTDELRLKIARKQERKVERRFMNMLTLFKSFLEQIQTLLKRNLKHLENSTEQWKLITKKAFDGCFSFRFIYKLRNYVQHVGMAPILWINSSRGVNDYIIKMYFSRDELLLNKDSLGAIVTSDLERMPEYIVASDIMDDLQACLSEVLYGLVKLVDGEVKKAALRVVSYRDGFLKNDDIGIFWVSIDLESNEFNADIVKYINDSNSFLICDGFPYSHDSVLRSDLQ
jgi:hypothetical protein